MKWRVAFPGAPAAAVLLAIITQSADARQWSHFPAHSHRHRTAGAWHGYGFLPGYRTPEQIDLERWRTGYPQWRIWYPWPSFYRGRWNGGGFGPCWTQTPIGFVWNCGK